MPIGFVVAATIMALPGSGRLGWALIPLAVVLVGLPALDTALVIVSRRRRGAGVFTGGRDHLTHRLRARLGSPRRVAMALATGQAFLCGAGAVLFEFDGSIAMAGSLTLILAGVAVVAAARVPRMGPSGNRDLDLSADGACASCRSSAASTWAARPTSPPCSAAGASPPTATRPCSSTAASPRARPRWPTWRRRRARGCASSASCGSRCSPLHDSRALLKLIRLARAFRPDVVHTHTAKAGFLGRQAALAVRPRPAIVHTYHGHVLEGYFGPAKSRLYLQLERALARVSDCLTGVSRATVDDLVRLGVAPAEKFRVLPLGLDLDRSPSYRRER